MGRCNIECYSAFSWWIILEISRVLNPEMCFQSISHLKAYPNSSPNFLSPLTVPISHTLQTLDLKSPIGSCPNNIIHRTTRRQSLQSRYRQLYIAIRAVAALSDDSGINSPVGAEVEDGDGVVADGFIAGGEECER